MRRVFILGAGFSYLLSGNRFPLGKSLLGLIRNDIVELKKGIHYRDEKDDIEKVLSRLSLDLEIDENKKATIQKTIFNHFQKAMLVKDLPQDVIDRGLEIVKKLFKKNDVVISLNYDLLLDHLLSKSGIWSPFGNGYGDSFVEDSFIGKRTDKLMNQGFKNIRLLKLHGSFNYFQKQFSISDLYSDCIDVLINDKHKSFFDRTDLFESVKHVHWGMNSEDKNFESIVPPTYIKPFAQNRTFIKLWHEAAKAMNTTNLITVIGYRFPPEDSMMSFLFSCPDAHVFFKKGKLKIHILNLESDVNFVQKHIIKVIRANSDTHLEWFLYPIEKINNPLEDLIKNLNKR